MSGQLLTSILGANATQTSSSVTISKTDLAAVGLTASGNNDGEAVFVAIVLLAKQYLTSANQTATPTIQTIITDATQPQYITRNSQLYKRDVVNISLDKPFTNSALDPDDY